MELKLTPRFLQNGQRFFGPGVAEHAAGIVHKISCIYK